MVYWIRLVRVVVVDGYGFDKQRVGGFVFMISLGRQKDWLCFDENFCYIY